MFSLHRFRSMPLLLLLLLLCAGVAGCGTSSSAATTYSHTVPENAVDVRPSQKLSPTPSETASTIPTRLVVPSVGINAPVETVGILPSGDLDTPPHSPWTDTGWYQNGPRPGEQGSSVIDGHLDRPGGYPAVFWLLRNLKVGDEVQVINTSGKTLHFRVTGVVYYPPTAAPIQQIFGDSSGKFLNLITCAGDWIPSEHQTTLRLVVYTTLM